MASSTLKGLVANSGKLGYQLWHRPLKMASLVYEREIGVSERERAIRPFLIVKNKLMSVFNESVLLLTMNFVITLSK